MSTDTHTLFKEFVALGFTEGQAERLSQLHVKDNRNYATKEQVDVLEKDQVDIKAEIKIIKSDIANIKENMATKRDIIEVKYDILKWMIPLLLAILIKLFWT